MRGNFFAVMCLMLAGYLIFPRASLAGFAWDRQKLDWTANPLILNTGIESLPDADRAGRTVHRAAGCAAIFVARLPARASSDRPDAGDGLKPFIYLGFATIVVFMMTALLALRRRSWNILFLLAALALSYGMVSNFLILIGTIMGERQMYLPSVFLFDMDCRPAFAIAEAGVLRRFGGAHRARDGSCILYARLWNDPLKLYLTDLAEYPGSMHLP